VAERTSPDHNSVQLSLHRFTWWALPASVALTDIMSHSQSRVLLILTHAWLSP